MAGHEASCVCVCDLPSSLCLVCVCVCMCVCVCVCVCACVCQLFHPRHKHYMLSFAHECLLDMGKHGRIRSLVHVCQLFHPALSVVHVCKRGIDHMDSRLVLAVLKWLDLLLQASYPQLKDAQCQ